MHNFIKFTSTLLVLTFLITACNRRTIQGEGFAQQEARGASQFSSIVVEGNYVIEGNLGTPQELVISSNPNLLPYIKSSVDDEILTIKNDDSVKLKPSVQQNIFFITEKFHALNLNGNSQFQMFDLNSEHLDCTLKGSHILILKGKVTHLKMVINGKANVNAQGLELKSADIEINGSALVGVQVSDHLKVKINGDGKVFYYNSQPKVEQTISGTGEVSSAFGAFQR